MDTWASGENYERYVGRWSRRVATQFLRWLAEPGGLNWLDVGCGTGMLCQAILEEAHPAAVTGIDASEGFLEYARRRAADLRLSFKAANAMSLPFDAATFDAAVSGLALNFFPRYDVAAGEMVRVVKPGGLVAAYVWDYAGVMQMMRVFWDAVAEFEGSDERDEGRRFPICRPGALEQLWASAGCLRVEVRGIDIETNFRDFDDYWQPFLGGQGAAPGYLATLPADKQALLREMTKARLPFAPDGSIPLRARAWAVRGRRPVQTS